MPDYQLGKIYKLSSPSNNLAYYGSTAQKHISTRIGGHIKDYKCYLNNKAHYVTSFEILECDDYKYELIEEYPCNNKPQLKKRERWYIQNNECVNKCIPGRTQAEWREANREYLLEQKQKWYQNNKERILEQTKEYREQNKDKIKERKQNYYQENIDKIKEFREVNKDKIKEQQKKYKQANKDKIKEYKNEVIVCECGCEVTRGMLWKHKKTKKHIKLMLG